MSRIRFDERFSTDRDLYGWRLYDHQNKRERVTYHANLMQVCNTILDRVAGPDPEDFLDGSPNDVIEYLHHMEKRLAQVIENSGLEKSKTPSS